MPEVIIDPGAVESARVSMLIVRDTLNGLHAQHTSEISEIENQLNDISASVMEQFDPFGIWERFGFDRASYHCQFIRGSIEQVRGDIERIMVHLCETHRGPLAGVVRDRAGDLLVAINSAMDSFWTLTSFFTMNNVMHMIKDHGLIQEHFGNSRRALSHACDQAQDFVDYLTRLQTREEQIIAEISGSFTVILPALVCSPEGAPTTFQTHSDLLLESWADILADKPLPAGSITAERAAIAAQEVSAWLTKGNDGYGHNGFFNHIDWSKVPGGKDGEIAKQLQKIFAESYDWQFGNNKYDPNIQCVALVSLSYQIATGRADVMPPRGNADHLWKAYANNAVSGWSEVTNKVGSPGWPPRVGDVMVSTSRCHVAIVTGVDYNPDGSVKTITITQANTDKFTQTYNVENGSIDPRAGADGFLRYTG